MKNLFLFLLLMAYPLYADQPTEEPEPQDYVTVSEGKASLELKLIPQTIIEGDNLSAGALTAVKKDDDVLGARVGELAFLVGQVTVDGKPVQNVQYELIFHHIEDGKDVFMTSVTSNNGSLNWGQQFFDGAMHRVTLKAKSTDNSFAPIMAEMNVDVEGIDPPTGVVIKSMVFLLGIAAIGMIIGYLISFKTISNKAIA